ncbi:MAG: YfhO family protein [Clostridiales bacterium]|nr:YfhO family protein [Clostridiales bacterium]
MKNNSKSKQITKNKKGMGKFFFEWRYVILAFVLAALLMNIVYILRQVYPYGPNTILKVDLYHQYGPYHEEFRSRILNGQSLFYSWEGGLGKNFVAQAAYYTASPISLLMLFFPQVHMAEAMALFILIKIAFAGAFCGIYIKKTYGKNDLSIVFFSLMYAFMSFMTGFYWNVMWLDAVALFPIVALGIESLVKDGKFKTYAISLALVIFINFYIAFMVCVFAALYYLVVLFSNYSFKRDFKTIKNRTILFAVMSLLAGGMAMVLMLPTAIALSETATSETSFPKFEVYQNIWQLLTNHFIGARPVVLGRNEDLPNIYTGLLTVMLLPYYYLDKNTKRKEKILYSALLIFMLLCSCIKPLDFMIHGMHFPSNLPHRFTFIYSFILLTMAYKAFLRFKEDRKLKFEYLFIICIVYVIWIFMTEFIFVSAIDDIERTLDNRDIVINIAAMIGYIIILYFYKGAKKVSLTPVYCILLVCIFAEMLFGSYTGLDRTTDRTAYVKYTEAADEAAAYMAENSEEFYRAEFRRFTAINEGALYHYPGFSQFSSMAPGDATSLVRSLGIAATSNSHRYYDPTALVDAMFSMKYIMEKDGTINNGRYEYLDTWETTLEDGTTSTVAIYENKYWLPLGFMVNSDIEDWEASDDIQPFTVQNEFIHKAAGIEEDMFTDVKLDDFSYENLRISKALGTDGEYETIEEDSPAYKLGDSESIDLRYELTNPSDLNAEPSVSASVTFEEDSYVYFYVDASNTKRVVYYINGSGKNDRELSTGRSLFDVGKVNAGDTLDISFSLTNRGEFEKTYRTSGDIKIYVAAYNEDVFLKAYDKLSENTMTVPVPEDDTVIEGTVTADKDGVLYTSIPYDKGWSLTVDGEKAEYIGIGGGGLIGVELTAGDHEIRFKYTPGGFFPGLAVSVISIGIFIAICIITSKKKKEAEKAL